MIIKYKRIYEMCFRLIEGPEGGGLGEGGDLTPPQKKGKKKKHRTTLNKCEKISAVQLTKQKHFDLYARHTLV